MLVVRLDGYYGIDDMSRNRILEFVFAGRILYQWLEVRDRSVTL